MPQSLRWLMIGMLVALLGLIIAAPGQAQGGVTYYVSSSGGSDSNDGLSESAPLATVSHVNGLALQPGDRVLFKCGDVWRADPLIITQSGTANNPITFGSYPANCTQKPVLTGAQPISGWSLHSSQIYVADLTAGANAGKFSYGINQLFEGQERLLLGRWPNLDAADGGYSTIDGQPAATQITDNELPAGDWTGAVAHIRGMRWYILNRAVTGRAGQALTLGNNTGCWDNNCTGWGYFLNSHLLTLDRDGEWYYDAAAGKVYLYRAAGPPADGQVEGTVILRTDDRAWGGVVLGNDLNEEISHVVVENFDIRRWYLHGITTPTNLKSYENSYLTLHQNTITDVDGEGINLATWVYDAQDGASGWRGGNNITVSNNIIDGANWRGIDTYTKHSTFTNNTIRNIGLIENLNASGMGCDLDASGNYCTEDGVGFRVKVSKEADSAHHNLIRYNRLENIAHNGLDIFGSNNTIEYNYIYQACYAKGDCGGVRTFGRNNLADTPVHDLTLRQNIIVNTIGNTDGCAAIYDPLFGFGLYIDNYSRDVTTTGNTVISSTAAGIHYQHSTGSIDQNSLYNNSRGSMYSAQVHVDESTSQASSHSQNVLYGLNTTARTLSVSVGATLTGSDHNYFFNPYLDKHISADGTKTLAQWQAHSGQDAHSTEHWFTLNPTDPPRSRIFYNATATNTTVNLGSTLYLDLDQRLVMESLALAPYSSQVLVTAGDVAELGLSMQAIGAGGATAPGAPISYTLTITNYGTLAATGVALTHTVPAEIINTAWSNSPGLAPVTAQPGSRYIWQLPDIAPHGAGVLTITGQYTATLTPNTPLLLEGLVSTTAAEASTLNNRAQLLLGQWTRAYLPLITKQ